MTIPPTTTTSGGRAVGGGRRRRYLPRLLATSVLPLSGVGLLLAGAVPASATTTAGSVPAPVTYTSSAAPIAGAVPAGVCSVTFDVVGGQGGGPEGGLAGEVTATLAVTPGEAYSVSVGSAGGAGVTTASQTPRPVNQLGGGGAGGVSGGAASGGAGGVGGMRQLGGGGGGASTVTVGTATAPQLVAAGGGGTGTANTDVTGTTAVNAINAGGTGGATGSAGASNDPGTAANGGGGATATWPGPAGTGAALPGAAGVGSVGGAGVAEQGAGGGGGGGAFGGGGGGDDSDWGGGGGGGGSNLAPTGATFDGTASATHVGNGSVITTFVACAVPSAPSGLVVDRRGGTATLSWSPPTTPGASPVTGYQVWESTSPDGSGGVLVASPSATSATVTGLDAATAYYFTVVAVTADGLSAFSAPVPGQAACLPHVVERLRAGRGIYTVTNCGNVYHHGMPFRGSPYADRVHLTSPVVAIGVEPDGDGYYVVTAAGNVYNEHAPFRGSPHASGLTLASPIEGIRVGAHGYTLVAADGATYHYGR